METFCNEYHNQLEWSREHDNENWTWSVSELPQVYERMRAAIARGTFNKDSKAFQRTCKALQIKHTYKAIADFIANHK